MIKTEPKQLEIDSQDILKDINEIIGKKIDVYKKSYEQMLSDYKIEERTYKDYNGRQLLELLQNCDDEGSEEVLFKINKEKQQISIHNQGTPFSKKGYRSLFFTDLSSKTDKTKYIGNKGLGFRSIINWASSIEIQSNNISLYYSESRREDNLKNLFTPEEIENIYTDRDFRKREIPIPFLTLPEVKEIEQKDYTTSIIITYDVDFLNDIIKQVNDITPETILFLKHINCIKFDGFENKNQFSCEKKNLYPTDFGPKYQISFDNGYVWDIFEEEESLPANLSEEGEKERYQIKIAIESKMRSTSNYLYSFFPTQIQLNQPYILHSTFELKSDRNQINDNAKNKFILNKIAKFTRDVALYFTKTEHSYKALKILTYTYQSEVLEKLGYYSLIEEYIKEEAIYPALDNKYYSEDDIVFISDSMGDVFESIGTFLGFEEHLLPISDTNYGKEFLIERLVKNDLNVLQNRINRFASSSLTIEQRAEFIYELVKNYRSVSGYRLVLVCNNENKIIPKEDYIYTPLTKGNELKTPSFTNIQFINTKLYELLLDKLEYEKPSSENKPRFIKNKLDGLCNIHSYEPATLANKITSVTNDELKKHPEKKQELIQEMNRSLFYNFLRFDDKTKISESIEIPTLDSEGKQRNTVELLFGKGYELGKITTEIFSEIYSPKDYVGSPKMLGLENENLSNIEAYLTWLGIQKHMVYKQKVSTPEELEAYKKEIDKKRSSKEHVVKTYDITITEAPKFVKSIQTLSLEHLIVWLYIDPIFKKQMESNTHNDSVKITYARRGRQTPEVVNDVGSYLQFLFKKYRGSKISEILLEDKYSWVNEQKINYESKLFKEVNISKSEINALLVKMGAKEDFKDLTITKVKDIINKLPKKSPSGKNTQTIYKKALTHYKEKNKTIEGELKLFANNGKGLIIEDNNKIYFGEKIKLPKKLWSDFPILNFPSRSGGKEAIKFFGVNDLSDLKVEVSNVCEAEIGNEFTEDFDKLKPLFLAYRISVLDDDKIKQAQANLCDELKIQLCYEVEYKVDDKVYDVDDYEFIYHSNQSYYLKIKEGDTLSKLKSNREFINVCADIITLAFDVTADKGDYKNILRSNFDDSLKDLDNEIGNDTYLEARQFLGMSDPKKAFWSSIFNIKGFDYKNVDDDIIAKFIHKYCETIDESHFDYENINSNEELDKLEKLLRELNVSLNDFCEKYSFEITLEERHFNTLEQLFLENSIVLKTNIYNELKDLQTEQQAQLYNRWNDVEKIKNNFEYIAKENKHSFEIEGNKIFAQLVKEHLKIELNDRNNGELLDIEKLFSISTNSFNEDELDEIKSSSELKSLVCFENNLELVKERLTKLSNKDVKIGSKNDSKSKQNKLVFKESDDLKTSHKNKASKPKKVKGIYNPSNRELKGLKKKGDEAETIIFNYIERHEDYKNVERVSSQNEGLHYDIRFEHKTKGVKYIEVKAFDNGHFYLSKAEYEFGKQNKNKYEIWLLKDSEYIIPIRDFYYNDKYEPIPSVYEVILDYQSNNTD